MHACELSPKLSEPVWDLRSYLRLICVLHPLVSRGRRGSHITHHDTAKLSFLSESSEGWGKNLTCAFHACLINSKHQSSMVEHGKKQRGSSVRQEEAFCAGAWFGNSGVGFVLDSKQCMWLDSKVYCLFSCNCVHNGLYYVYRTNRNHKSSKEALNCKNKINCKMGGEGVISAVRGSWLKTRSKGTVKKVKLGKRRGSHLRSCARLTVNAWHLSETILERQKPKNHWPWNLLTAW